MRGFILLAILLTGCVVDESGGPAPSPTHGDGDPNMEQPGPKPTCDRYAAIPHFVDSADGLSCQLNDQLCVSDDPMVCPELDQPSCPNGTIAIEDETAPSRYDGVFCNRARYHCLSPACPPPPPLPDSYCAGGVGNLVGVATFVAASDGMECLDGHYYCVTNDFGACP